MVRRHCVEGPGGCALLGAALLALACAAHATRPPAAPAPPPTRSECAALVDRIGRLLADQGTADRESEIADCLAMPPSLVSCLEDAGSKPHVAACVDAYLGPPSHADCKLAVAHLQNLDPGYAESAEDEAVETCVERGSRFVLSCIGRATTMAEADACEAR